MNRLEKDLVVPSVDKGRELGRTYPVSAVSTRNMRCGREGASGRGGGQNEEVVHHGARRRYSSGGWFDGAETL